jgi:hypothetical protein
MTGSCWRDAPDRSRCQRTDAVDSGEDWRMLAEEPVVPVS